MGRPETSVTSPPASVNTRYPAATSQTQSTYPSRGRRRKHSASPRANRPYLPCPSIRTQFAMSRAVLPVPPSSSPPVVVDVVVAIRASGPSTIRAISSTVPSGSEKERSTPRQNLASRDSGVADVPSSLDGATRSRFHDDDDIVVASSSGEDAHFECDDEPSAPADASSSSP